MGASPGLKVYYPDGEYVASCKYHVDALKMVAWHDGCTIRFAHSKRCTIWTEGDGERADESYDEATDLMVEREQKIQAELLDEAK